MVKVGGIASTEREIVVYDKNIKNNRVKICFDNKLKTVSYNTFSEWRDKMAYDDRKPVLVPYDKTMLLVSNNMKKTMKEFYSELIEVVEALKKETNGTINMYKTGRFTKTALDYYYRKCFDKKLNIEDITFEEAQWIENASTGALMIAKKYKGKAYSYDFISFYSSIMKDNKMLFPIKQGEFKTLTREEFNKLEFFQYGIYRVKISKSDDWNINRCFRFNPKQYYTQIDLRLAKQLKLEIEIIEDESPNFLHYSREKLVSGKDLFGEYINYFYELKKRNILGAKLLLNCLWGALCECNLIKVKFDLKKGLKLKQEKEILDITTLSNNVMLAHIVNKNKYFEYNLARIKCFILAKSRFTLSNAIQPHIDNLVFSHTDSIISKEKLNIKPGTKIGELKYEGFNENFWVETVTHKAKKDTFKL